MTVSADDVLAWMNIGNAQPDKRDQVEVALSAVKAYAPTRWELIPTDEGDWTPDLDMAIKMLTARMLKRRATPEGIAGGDEFGFIRITAYDPDVARLMYRYEKPSIA